MSLARQFVIAAGGVLLAGMLVIGLWVSGRIEEGVTRNTASATALYVDSVIAPVLPTIRGGEPLSEGALRALDEVIANTPVGARIASFKLWAADGTVVYSSRPELIGRRFEPTENLRAALAGAVTADFDELTDDEDALERAEGRPLLEIYSPVRAPWSGRVVAVAEFYEIADDLERALAAARLESWLVVAAVTLAMIGLLFGIVLRGSRTIIMQREELERRVAELSGLLAQNEDLRQGLRSAAGRAAALNERYLRRVSADLHDGPAQLLALASLRLGADEGAGLGELTSVRDHLDDAMREIRDICRGLALPEIERLPLDRLAAAAVDAHRSRTGTEVRLSPAGVDPPLTPEERICAFRFVQEGLRNAWRHAGGVGQKVTLSIAGGRLSVTVEDDGPGFDLAAGTGDRLGLSGLRDRVESLGGRFEVESGATGTRLLMTLTINEGPGR